MPPKRKSLMEQVGILFGSILIFGWSALSQLYAVMIIYSSSFENPINVNPNLRVLTSLGIFFGFFLYLWLFLNMHRNKTWAKRP